MKKISIIQSSLRKSGNTQIVCREFEKKLSQFDCDINYIDLKNVEIEFCDGRSLDQYNLDLQNIYATLDESDVIIFGMPVYQYSMSWVLKNLIDIVWGALQSKQIWILVNAWGPNCYMASRDLFDALYYEYQTQNLAPTPYSWSMDFKDGKLVNQKTIDKLDELVATIIK